MASKRHEHCKIYLARLVSTTQDEGVEEWVEANSHGQIGQGGVSTVRKISMSTNTQWFSGNGFDQMEEDLALKIFDGYLGLQGSREAFLHERHMFETVSRLPDADKYFVRCFDGVRILEHLQDKTIEYGLLFELANYDLEALLTTEGLLSPMSYGDLLRGCGQFIRGLELLHSTSSDGGMNRYCFIHGDIRPRNILCFDYNLKIADFHLCGTCRLEGLQDVDNMVGITVKRPCGAFDAPEIWDRRQAYPASDIWSAGAVLMDILTRIVGGVAKLKMFRANRRLKGSDTFFIHTEDTGSSSPKVDPLVEAWPTELAKARADSELSVVESKALTMMKYIVAEVLVTDYKARSNVSAADLALKWDELFGQFLSPA